MRRLSKITFPRPRGLNFNMMPFKIKNIKTLPKSLRPYYPIIQQCCDRDEFGYLSVQESWVLEGETQRRPGPHTDGFKDSRWGGGWGCGEKNGGIYLASNVPFSCRIWPIIVENPGHLGDCSSIKLGKSIFQEANTLYWITDRTPHESMQLSKLTYRQWFRLVIGGGRVSVWYAKHNTPNPLGIKPDCKITYEDKFSEL